MLNLVFILIYAFLTNALSARIIYIIFSVHCVLLLIPHLRQKKVEITPLILYIIGVIIVNISNFLLIGIVGTARNQMYKYIIPEYIDLATQVWCISCTFTFIGYELIKTKSAPAIDLIVKNKKTLSSIFYVLMTVDLLQLAGVRLFNITQVVKFIGVANLIGILFFVRLWVKNKDGTYLVYWLSLYIFQSYTALFTYLRINIILPTVVLFIGYFMGKGETKYLFSYRVIPFLIVFGFYMSVFKELGYIRGNFYYSIADLTKSKKQEPTVTRTARFLNEQETVVGSGSGLLDRTANLAQMTCVANLVAKNGFYDGQASQPLLIALIPRFLWPNKPSIAIGKWFALEIGVGYANEAGVINNSINMTIPGELYLDFGWFGVVLGSMLLGAFFAALWNATKFNSSDYNIGGILFGGNLLLLAFIGFGVDLQIIITVLSLYFSFLVVKKLVKVR